MSLQGVLQQIKSVIDGLRRNPVARLAYSNTAFNNDVVDGVDAFSNSAEQNIPNANRTDYNPTITDKGVRLQGASIPRNAWNHYLGRTSYNLNKLIQETADIIDFLSSALNQGGFKYDSQAVYAAGDVCFYVDNTGEITWYKRNTTFFNGTVPLTALYWDILPDSVTVEGLELLGEKLDQYQTTITEELNQHQSAAIIDHPNGSVTAAKIAAAVKSTTTPKVNGAATAGSEEAFARGDHVHPTDTSRAPTSAATANANGLMSAGDKSKLDGIAPNANNYSHPANHPPSIISQDANNRFVTDTERVAWNAKADTTYIDAINVALSGAIQAVSNVLDNVLATRLDSVYPVGTIYQSVVNYSPAYFIGGTWTSWGHGRVSIGTGPTSNTMIGYCEVEVEGGLNFVTLTMNEIPSHRHAQSAHSHTIAVPSNPVASTQNLNVGQFLANAQYDSHGSISYAASSVTPPALGLAGGYQSVEGSAYSHENRMPYITCHKWKRTA